MRRDDDVTMEGAVGTGGTRNLRVVGGTARKAPARGKGRASASKATGDGGEEGDACPCAYHRLGRGEAVDLDGLEGWQPFHGRDVCRRLLARMAEARLGGDWATCTRDAYRLHLVTGALLREAGRYLQLAQLEAGTALV